MHGGESTELGVELFSGGLGEADLVDAFAVLLDLAFGVVDFTEFGLDGSHLLPEEELALALVHLIPNSGRDQLLQFEQGDFALEQGVDERETRLDGIGLEHLLCIGDRQTEIGGGKIGETNRVFEIGREDHDLGRDALAQALDLLQAGPYVPDRGFDFQTVVLDEGGFLEQADPRREMGFGVGEVVGVGAGETLNEDALAAVREFHRPHDGADAPDRVEIILRGFADLRIPL